MAIEKYGIYLAYPPTVDLRKEGLGHYLVSFLKGAAEMGNVRFVIVCPGWSKQSLIELCKSNQLNTDSFDIISPRSKSYALRLYLRLLSLRKEPPKGRWANFIKMVSLRYASVIRGLEYRLLSITNVLGFLFFLPLLFIYILHIGFALTFRLFLRLLTRLGASILSIVQRFNIFRFNVFGSPKDSSYVQRLYQVLEFQETDKLAQICDANRDVKAWYCPTAFWPSFNNIKAPRLLCVPDVVLSDFPVGFAQIGGQRFITSFDKVERTILGATNVVTYSSNTKNKVLVERYGFAQEKVSVVLHAPMLLDRNIPNISQTPERLTKKICFDVLSTALNRSSYALPKGVDKPFNFIFYASQFRPNKNILTLLKAYKSLLKDGLIFHKLILTGNMDGYPTVKDFIEANGLTENVLCLSGLSLEELSAAYYLADIAINPSLSEGGAPFSFTEALSVKTPIVMSRISVTEEVLNTESIQQYTLFDPYSWSDTADKIFYAIDNKEELLEKQLQFYEQLVERTWTDVTSEHVAVLKRIAGPLND